MDQTRGQQGGIQMLLAAEHEAQQIVTSARNRKMARLRQAKEEAEREVANFRSQMEADYQKHISESTGSSDSTVKRLEADTEAQIKNLKDKAAKFSPDVTKKLLSIILTVKN